MKGVIYCRVSSKEQTEGTSLASQQAACSDYAQANGIDVLKIFVEEGESAKFADRTKLLELIDYCRTHKGQVDALLVWKVDRFARNVADHFNVKATLAKAGVRIVSVTEPIDGNPEGRLMETILAGFAQFDNDVRAMRTVQGMKRKLQEGLFPWHPPLGYKTVTQNGNKKTQPDEPDEPRFNLLKRAWKEFLTGAHTKADIVRIMRAWGLETKTGSPLTPQAVDRLFENPFYAGFVVDPWTGEEHQGLHIPMVSKEEFAAVQAIIKRRSQSRPHCRHREEFPLRGLVRCPACHWFLTASLSRGRSARYPYYHCHNRSCPRLQKTVAAKVVEEEFIRHLEKLTPTEAAFEQFQGVVLLKAEESGAAEADREARRQNALKRVKSRLAKLIDLRTENLISDDEFGDHRTTLLAEEHRLRTTSTSGCDLVAELQRGFTEVRESLCSLVPTWAALPQRIRARFQQIIHPVGYTLGKVRTAELGQMFSLFQAFGNAGSHGVPPAGFSSNQIEEELGSFALVLREYHEEKSKSIGWFEDPAQ